MNERIINVYHRFYFLDWTEKRVYWISYYGDIKSVNVDGSDLSTVVSVNAGSNDYFALGVMGNYIYFGDNNNQLVMINKAQGSTPTVLHADNSRINSIYMFKSIGMYIILK